MRLVHVLACFPLVAGSSIPDVAFEDSDAGATSSGGGGQWSCPSNPPPAGRGVCCGDRLCLRCSENHCDRCQRESCSGGAVCCRTFSNVECRRQSSCD